MDGKSKKKMGKDVKSEKVKKSLESLDKKDELKLHEIKDSKKEFKDVKNLKIRKFIFMKKRFLLLIAVAVLVLFLVSLLFFLFESGVIGNPLDSVFSKTEVYNIRDECSLIAGQLIKIIANEEDCESRCKNFCGVLDKKFIDSDFTESQFDCNLCQCSCR
jgi:hypothetical protein